MGDDYEIIYYEEDGGRCRTEEFLDALEGDCEAQADALLTKLLENGLGLAKTKFAKQLKGKHNDLWELKDHCHRRAIRFYYWRSGPTQFIVAWGELKEGDEPDKEILDYAAECHKTWKSQQRAQAKSKRAPRRQRK